MKTRTQVGHCCNCDCDIGSDDFSGSLSQWSTTGSPSTSSGKLLMSAADRVIFTPAPLTADAGVHIETSPLTTDATATVRLLAAWTDANNFLFGEFDKASGAGTLRLGKKVGGAESWLTDIVTVEDTNSELDARSTLELCWQPGPTQEGEAQSQTGKNPSRIDSADGWQNLDFACVPDSSEAAFLFTFDGQTAAFTAIGFSFVVPPGSTIDGIGVSIYCYDGNHNPAEIENTSLRLIGINGPTGDDNAVGAIPIVSGGTIGAGGSTDDWNAGLTWEDINSPAFGITCEFTWVDALTTAEADLLVDGIVLSIWYTTPDRARGKLTLAYSNTGSATVDCVTEHSAFAPWEGLKTGIAVSAGDWDFEDYTLAYLYNASSRPTCPDCDCVDEAEPCGCCAAAPSEAYIVDLGAGGWTDDNCSGCADISGEFVVDAIASCFWLYFQPLGCCNADCGGDGGDISGLYVEATLVEDTVYGTGCRWVVRVRFPEDYPAGAGPFFGFSDATWVSDEDPPCDDEVTLSKILDRGSACTGTLPDTITIFPA